MVELFYVRYEKSIYEKLLHDKKIISKENNHIISNHNMLKHEIAYRMLLYYLKNKKIDIKECGLAKSDKGKPYFTNIKNVIFNISHSDNLVILGVCDEEIGVDAEKVRICKPIVANKIFTKNQLIYLKKSADKDVYFTKIWTLKESFIKNIGTGLAYPLDNIEVYIDDNDKIINNIKGYYFDQLSIENNIVSICTLNKKNIKVTDLTKNLTSELR